MLCNRFIWCFIGHFVMLSWITSFAHGSALKVSEPLYLHVGSSDSDSDMGYIKNMKDDGKTGYSHFESFHNKDGDDYGYEKHEAFGYSDNKDTNGDEKAELKEDTTANKEHEDTKAQLNEPPKQNDVGDSKKSDAEVNSKKSDAEVDLKDKPIVVAEEENQVENYDDTEDDTQKATNPDVEDYQPQGGEDHLKNEDYVENEHHETNQDHEDIKKEDDVEAPKEDHHEADDGKVNYTKIDRSDDNIEETPEDEGVEDHQDLKEDQEDQEDLKEDQEEEHIEPEEYNEEYDNEDDEKKKTTRNANEEKDKPNDIYVNHKYEVTENAEIIEGDQTQQIKFPYGFFSPLTNQPYVQTPFPATQSTPLSNLNTRVNYGFYSPYTGIKAPQPTRPLAPTFSPRLAPLTKARKNLGSFGYETMIYHHPGNNPERQAIQIKIYDGEISVPATNVKGAEEEKTKNTVDYDDDEDESGEVEEKQNLRQESAEEESGEDSSEESVEKKPSSRYQHKPNSAEASGSAEDEDSDDLQSRLVTTSDVDNDAYYWL